MKVSCQEASKWVPRALMGDLTDKEEEALNAHLQECAACVSEQRLYVDTLNQVRALSDSPVPRHFFVYPSDRGWSVTELFRAVSPGWKLAASFALTLTILGAVVAARVQFRAEAGVYSFSFGRPLPAVVPIKAPAAQIETLRAELTDLLDARSRAERAQWMAALRREVQESKLYRTQQQQQWNAALTSLEGRVNDRIGESAMVLTAGMRQSADNTMRALQRQRQQDMELTRALEQLATRGELKSQETDEILLALLQVARLAEK